MSPTIQAVRLVTGKGGILKLVRAAYRAAPLLLYLPSHIKLMRTLTNPYVSGLTNRRPKLAYKYLYRPYLVQCFSRKDRLLQLQHHYAFLSERVTREFFAKIFDANYTLWEERHEDTVCSITLAFPVEWEHDYEGDLLLTFLCNDRPIYTLTFTIAAGRLLDIDSEQVILVTAIQGKAGTTDLIRLATKHYHDLSPPMLLVAAAEGVALSMDIRALAGIGLDQQVQYQTWGNDRFRFDYDEFWRGMIEERTNGIFYLQPIPAPQKAIEEIRSKHRKKTLLRRQIKAGIRSTVQLNFQKECLRSSSREQSISPSGLIPVE